MENTEVERNFNEQPQKVVKWDLKGVQMDNQAEIQLALEEGYEPFSVTPMMRKAQPNVVALNPNQPNQMVMETIIWMKRPNLVEMQ